MVVSSAVVVSAGMVASAVASPIVVASVAGVDTASAVAAAVAAAATAVTSLFGAVLVSAVASALAVVDVAEAAGDPLAAAVDADGEAEDDVDADEEAEDGVDADGVVPQPATSRATSAISRTVDRRWFFFDTLITSITIVLADNGPMRSTAT